MILYNDKKEHYSLGQIESKRYKISCSFNGDFHIKFILRTEQQEINITQNIYSDKGVYKFKFRFPYTGELLIKQSLDRTNDWTQLDYQIKELDE